MIKNCLLCNLQITNKNNTKEHIIPNSIGGRKTVKDFICNSCNNRLGETWDAELARFLNIFSLLLNIKRLRGNPPKEKLKTTNNQRILLHSNGKFTLDEKPVCEINKISDNELSLNIHANSEEQLNNIIKGIKKKYPAINEHELHSLVEDKPIDKVQAGFSFDFSNINIYKSLIKATLALVADSGIEAKKCNLALDFLKSEIPPSSCIGYYYKQDLIKNRKDLPFIFHCVTVHGDSMSNSIMGYIELYSWLRMVVCLSDNYKGDSFNNSYAIDPLTGKEVNMCVDLSSLSKEIIKDHPYNELYSKELSDQLSKILKFAHTYADLEKGLNFIVEYKVNKTLSEFNSMNLSIIDDIDKLAEILEKHIAGIADENNINYIMELVIKKLQPILIQKVNERNAHYRKSFNK